MPDDSLPHNNNFVRLQSRRKFLGMIAAVGAIFTTSPADALSIPPAGPKPILDLPWLLDPGVPGRKPEIELDRRISLVNSNTSEEISISYFRNGRYVPEAIERLQWFLRDHHENKIHEIDLRLYDILQAIQFNLSPNKPITITSGYRTERTNRELSKNVRGVSSNSYHINGMALDIRVDGYRPSQICRFLKRLDPKYQVGGVGQYARHTHVDTGPRRTWRS